MNIIVPKNNDSQKSGMFVWVNIPRKDVYRMVKIKDVRDVLLSTFAGWACLWCRLIVIACKAMTYATLAVMKYVVKCCSQSSNGNQSR